MQIIDRIYQTFHKILFGIQAEHTPPVWLWALFAAITAARLVPATFSQWEDPLFALVTEVDAPWLVTLGFATDDAVHIVYCVLAKVLIKATGHHFVEFVYRIPSLLAALMIMPLGFAVFSRIGGRLCGMLFGLCAVLLPSFTRYSVDSRAYMVMMFTMIWALGLTPGLSVRFRPVRLAIAYFLTGISQGLGIFVIGCFAVFGCFTGPVKHRRSVVLVNILLTLPVYAYSIPVIKNMLIYHNDHVKSVREGLLAQWLFVPKWIDYQFGVPFAPFGAPVFCMLIAAGVFVTFRESWKTGITLVLFMACIPLLFGVTGNDYTLFRYSMISLPFWLLALCRGGARIPDMFPRFKHANTAVMVGLCAFLLLLSPRTADCLRYPEQDYRGAYRMIIREYPGENTVFGFAKTYSNGLSYYARQFGLEYRVLEKKKDLADSAWAASLVHCIIVAEDYDLKPEMRQWLADSAMLKKEFPGNALPTRLYIAGGR